MSPLSNRRKSIPCISKVNFTPSKRPVKRNVFSRTEKRPESVEEIKFTMKDYGNTATRPQPIRTNELVEEP